MDFEFKGLNTLAALKRTIRRKLEATSKQV
jgi:hypothetical protein